MLTYTLLRRRPQHFQCMTGMSVAEFDALYDQVEPAWVAAEQERLSRPGRRRAIGAGPGYRHTLQTQLVLLLVWLRLYLTTAALGVLFGVDKATVSRICRRLLPIVRQVSQADVIWTEPPQRGQGRALDQALAACPDLARILDATEQPVQRPNKRRDPEREKRYYSGKKRCHTCKYALVVNEQGLICNVSPTTPGGVHDLTHVRQAGLLTPLPLSKVVVADAGFDGLANDLPEHGVATARKAYRDHPLTEEDLAFNRDLSRTRVVVENAFSRLKHFRSLSDRFRHVVEQVHSDIVLVLAAIVNRRTQRRLLQRS